MTKSNKEIIEYQKLLKKCQKNNIIFDYPENNKLIKDNIKIDFEDTILTAKQNKQHNKNLLLYGISCIVMDSCQKITVVPTNKVYNMTKKECKQ